MIKLKNILLEEPGTKQTISDLRDGAKVWNGIYNATLNWKKHLVDVGATTVTSSGKKRNELTNPEWDNLPEWLKGNGSHPYGDRIWLWPAAGRAFLKMKEAAEADGVRIVVTNAYRDVFHQALVKKINTTGKTGNPVAGLGKSNHGFGLAIDVSRGAGRDWMIKNGLRYGWAWFGSGDAPHFNYYPILLANNLRFTSDVSKRKLRRYLKKADKKMAKIGLPDIQTAVEKANTTTPNSTQNHYGNIKSDPTTYNYPLLTSANFEAWKDSIDSKTNIPFFKLYPIVLIGDIDSATAVITKQYDTASKGWKTLQKIFPDTNVVAKNVLTEVQIKNIDDAINSVISQKNLKILVKAISKKEGWIATSNAGLGSRAYRNNNPGNLDYQSSFKQIDPNVKLEKKLQGGKLTDEDGRFAHFSTPEFGVQALRDKILRWSKGKMPITAGNQSLIARDFGDEFKWKKGTPPSVLQFMYTYAPPNENSSINYIDYILSEFGYKAPYDTTRNLPMISVLSA